MNGRRPDWKVRFAFYGNKNKEALAMASIGWKKRADVDILIRRSKQLFFFPFLEARRCPWFSFLEQRRWKGVQFNVHLVILVESHFIVIGWRLGLLDLTHKLIERAHWHCPLDRRLTYHIKQPNRLHSSSSLRKERRASSSIDEAWKGFTGMLYSIKPGIGQPLIYSV